MLHQGEQETLARALKYLDGQRALYQQALDALQRVFFVEGVDAAAILGSKLLELPAPAAAPEPAPVLELEPPKPERTEKKHHGRVPSRTRKAKAAAAPAGKPKVGRRGGGNGSVSAAIVALLTKKPAATPAEIAAEVYGEASVNASRRAADMVTYLRRTGRIKKPQGSRLKLIRDAAAKRKPTGATSKRARRYQHEPATRKARAARTRGRPNNAPPPMFRCKECLGLFFEKQLVEHLSEAHGITCEPAAAREKFAPVKE